MTEKIKKINGITIAVILLAVGVLMVLFSGKKDGSTEPVEKYVFDESAYEEQLEKRLKDIVENIDGVGNVSVMITLEGSAVYTYATDTAYDTHADGDSKTQSNVVLSVKGSNNKEAVISGYKLPSVKGAAVVCSRALSPSLEMKVVGIVSSALGIPTNRIFVTN
ncbi:MAG: hypothetical protein E7613_06330 [Ruminococcaceae bacterium]|nr:hypothetical protein [Oscillospiraceae bacterium]